MEIIKKIGNENRKKYVEIKETEYSWFFEKVIRKAEEIENKYKAGALHITNGNCSPP